MRWWFGRKSAPEAIACAYAPPPWLVGSCEEGFARSYESQVAEVYRNNPVGLRAVRLVAGAIGGLTVEAQNDEAARLAKDVLEGVAAALLLNGNAFVQLIADSYGAPKELALLRPERVSIATDERGHAAAFVYRAGGRAVRIAARDALHRRQVAHIRALNPGDDHLGLGCLDAAIAAASIHNRASRWNAAGDLDGRDQQIELAGGNSRAVIFDGAHGPAAGLQRVAGQIFGAPIDGIVEDRFRVLQQEAHACVLEVERMSAGSGASVRSGVAV